MKKGIDSVKMVNSNINLIYPSDHRCDFSKADKNYIYWSYSLEKKTSNEIKRISAKLDSTNRNIKDIREVVTKCISEAKEPHAPSKISVIKNHDIIVLICYPFVVYFLIEMLKCFISWISRRRYNITKTQRFIDKVREYEDALVKYLELVKSYYTEIESTNRVEMLSPISSKLKSIKISKDEFESVLVFNHNELILTEIMDKINLSKVLIETVTSNHKILFDSYFDSYQKMKSSGVKLYSKLLVIAGKHWDGSEKNLLDPIVNNLIDAYEEDNLDIFSRCQKTLANSNLSNVEEIKDLIDLISKYKLTVKQTRL
ncbi:hypothetical protein K5X82_13620 [Halosquirtibacter xylanolyticus]|uniref:hypothetical protein n=1 Tax=Halosquirtibacter xylanolyticus TaxID=3374599 RepID=UPI003749D8A8|nr:hypothetical protein K5X82_13620 [Prolixibacteraceae bacterium]